MFWPLPNTLLLLLLLLLLQGKLPALPGQRPTMADWENHLTTIFPEVGLTQQPHAAHM
jgi:hypothetical protein